MAKKRNSQRTLIIFASIFTVLLIAVLIARSAGWIGKEKPLEVETVRVKYGEVTERVTSSGKIQPETEVKVSPDVSGEVIEVFVAEGDSVVKGQLLLKIRPDNIRAAVENAQANVNARKANLAQAQAAYYQAQARLTRTKLDFERQKQLFQQKVISEADFQLAQMNYDIAQQDLLSAKENVEAAKFALQSAEANLNQNLDNLSRTNVYAPMSGIVSKMSVEVGEKVVGTAQMAGTEMLRIANLNSMEVEVDVNENDIVRVSLGDTALIEVDSYLNLGRKFKGVVTQIANTANIAVSADAVTEFKVKIRILNESYKDLVTEKKRSPFRPGMSASVEIITDRKNNVLLVPLAAVTIRESEGINSTNYNVNSSADEKDKSKAKKATKIVFVYDEKEQKARKREVEVGISDFENIEVKSGLKEGEEIISGPFIMVSKLLQDQSKVQKIGKNRSKVNKK
ncbi:MAG: efflux RND transporter periplasmic adaptor subunit [Microscillaceae bacterium]|nr:efflux RND transporter periplasmic adaptor subunit [Microscillaceae bacterium]MDW8459748.1 efflux RND transporter periplasmic adaptor subunit [Cytophagales bacterium]